MNTRDDQYGLLASAEDDGVTDPSDLDLDIPLDETDEYDDPDDPTWWDEGDYEVDGFGIRIYDHMGD